MPGTLVLLFAIDLSGIDLPLPLIGPHGKITLHLEIIKLLNHLIR